MKTSKVQVEVCDACGADIRDGSLYCYNCGGKVAEDNGGVDLNEARTAKPLARMPGSKKQTLTPLKLQTEHATAESNGAISQMQPAGIAVQKAETRRPRPLSARRERKPDEVVWEQAPESGLRFFVFALVLALFVVVLLAAAMYLR